MDYPIEASCQCGQVSYKLFTAPKKVIACHCQECQKLSTAPFSVTAMVPADAIEFSGEMNKWGRVAASGNQNDGYSCRTCGNRIYQINPAQPDLLKLKLKPVGLKNDALFEPQAHVWVSEKLSWVVLPEGVPAFDKQV
ncbi:GFA family protein [Vibrio furnissii]|uniref:GFA family protein n=1 Tax=Vibrio furnissii TaxID=29494 RepID=UPI001302D8B4|nr:GFA family protein [Vibrio furnissii]MCG6213079.1 GFA family protein [Vibrio furnissii]